MIQIIDIDGEEIQFRKPFAKLLPHSVIGFVVLNNICHGLCDPVTSVPTIRTSVVDAVTAILIFVVRALDVYTSAVTLVWVCAALHNGGMAAYCDLIIVRVTKPRAAGTRALDVGVHPVTCIASQARLNAEDFAEDLLEYRFERWNSSGDKAGVELGAHPNGESCTVNYRIGQQRQTVNNGRMVDVTSGISSQPQFRQLKTFGDCADCGKKSNQENASKRPSVVD